MAIKRLLKEKKVPLYAVILMALVAVGLAYASMVIITRIWYVRQSVWKFEADPDVDIGQVMWVEIAQESMMPGPMVIEAQLWSPLWPHYPAYALNQIHKGNIVCIFSISETLQDSFPVDRLYRVEVLIGDVRIARRYIEQGVAIPEEREGVLCIIDVGKEIPSEILVLVVREVID